MEQDENTESKEPEAKEMLECNFCGEIFSEGERGYFRHPKTEHLICMKCTEGISTTMVHNLLRIAFINPTLIDKLKGLEELKNQIHEIKEIVLANFPPVTKRKENG